MAYVTHYRGSGFHFPNTKTVRSELPVSNTDMFLNLNDMLPIPNFESSERPTEKCPMDIQSKKKIKHVRNRLPRL